MTLVRVASFEGVTAARIDEMQRALAGEEDTGAVPASEVIVLHDAAAETSLIILFFENEEDYERGDESLNALPPDEWLGRRVSVTKYEVSFRKGDEGK
jgi:hypothetical protein